jgi:glutaredoxin
MREKVIIYGKDTCPYTTAARDDYAKKGYDVEYINVRESKDRLAEMLKISGGRANIPVIVEGGMVAVGYGGT